LRHQRFSQQFQNFGLYVVITIQHWVVPLHIRTRPQIDPWAQ
jgi:hypothetical protein